MTRQLSVQPGEFTLSDQFGARVAHFLDEGAREIPRDIGERLRAARTQAVAHRRVSESVAAPAVIAHGNEATLGGGMGFWGGAASWLPFVVLVIGLMGIGTLQDQMRASEVAAVDTELLTGDLPTAAYTDPGFAQYLQRATKE